MLIINFDRYIRAQVTRIDLKIDMALNEVNKRYKKLIRSATGTSYALFGPSINRVVATNNVTKAIINCFGLPSVSADTAVEVLKATVWTTRGTNVVLALASGLQLIGVSLYRLLKHACPAAEMVSGYCAISSPALEIRHECLCPALLSNNWLSGSRRR